jgi:hypothetical protein
MQNICYLPCYAVTPDARQLVGLTLPIHPQPSSTIAIKERESPGGANEKTLINRFLIDDQINDQTAGSQFLC